MSIVDILRDSAKAFRDDEEYHRLKAATLKDNIPEHYQHAVRSQLLAERCETALAGLEALGGPPGSSSYFMRPASKAPPEPPVVAPEEPTEAIPDTLVSNLETETECIPGPDPWPEVEIPPEPEVQPLERPHTYSTTYLVELIAEGNWAKARKGLALQAKYLPFGRTDFRALAINLLDEVITIALKNSPLQKQLDEAQVRAKELQEALQLAGNRLNACAITAIATGMRERAEWAEWADKALTAAGSETKVQD